MVLAAIVRIAERVCAACILRSAVVIDSTPSVIFRKELLDFPVALLRTNAKFKIFLRNGIPVLEDTSAVVPRKISSTRNYLVHHHDC